VDSNHKSALCIKFHYINGCSEDGRETTMYNNYYKWDWSKKGKVDITSLKTQLITS